MYFLDNCGGLGTLVNLIKNVLGLVFIILAVVLVVLIIIDLAKAVIASEEKEVNNTSSSFSSITDSTLFDTPSYVLFLLITSRSFLIQSSPFIFPLLFIFL